MEGTPLSDAITTTGQPTPTLSETGALPAGLSFTDDGNGTATLAGTPTMGGQATVTVTAANGVGQPATQTLVVTIDQAPAFTSSSSASAVMGTPFSYTVSTAGFPVPTLSEAGSLPPGLTFTDNGNGTATIAGTPTTLGTSTLTLGAANGISPDASQTLTLVVGTAPAQPTATTTSNPCGHDPWAQRSSSGWSGTGDHSTSSPSQSNQLTSDQQQWSQRQDATTTWQRQPTADPPADAGAASQTNSAGSSGNPCPHQNDQGTTS
jgi:hypothetical protein